MDYLSNIELYYSPPSNYKGGEVKIEGDEQKHITKVMRHSVHDLVYVTDGIGHIFECEVYEINKDNLNLIVKNTLTYKNEFSNVIFCIPKLKNPERFEFALEKCTELGITNFIVFESSRTVSKADKIDRWNKIVLSAMKQSLRSYLPQISISISLSEIIKQKGEKIIFEQNAKTFFNPEIINPLKNYLFIFGPEGGLSDEEVERINKDYLLKLAENRLRTETAIVKCASILTL